jgi:demethylmenaquinone methyltransferase/2-methoxy-6-polyprenyl-1,4-benzoquinol methylase
VPGRSAAGVRADHDGVVTWHTVIYPSDGGGGVESVQRSRIEPNVFARELFEGLPTRYDLLAEVLSFGQNHRWRRTMVDAVLRINGSSGRVLDVATGTAGVSLMFTDRSNVTTTGIDVSPDMLRGGQNRVARRGRSDRIRLVLGKAEQLPFPDDTFDALTFTYLLRYVANPAATLRELFRVVRPGGAIANLEFLVPSNPVWKAAWIGYTRAVLPAAGLVTGGREWAKVGRFLGPSISDHYDKYPVEWTIDAWRSAGALDVTVRRMSLGGGLVMWGRKSP